MEDKLIEILTETFGYPVIRQGSLAPDEAYPDHFFTYWNPDSDDHGYYDNRRFGVSSVYDVMFYSIDTDLCYSTIRAAQAELIENGWVSAGDGYDVASDEPSHIGRGITASFLKL